MVIPGHYCYLWKNQTGRNSEIEIWWLWTTHSLLFTQLPANMCISISHFSLELISGLNHHHMKDDFSKTAAFQNLPYSSNITYLVLSYCFYWNLPELQQNYPAISAVPLAGGIPPNHFMMKEEERVWSKGTFCKVCYLPSASASKSDSICWLHSHSHVTKKILVMMFSKQ